MNEETVKKWILQAEDDLKTAQHEFHFENPVTRSICFHSQQCVEKYLKAYLIFHGKEIRKTHDIAILIELCSEIAPEFKEMLKWNVDSLTEYAVSARYPDEFRVPTIEEARKAKDIAEKVKKFVLNKLKEEGLEVGEI